MSKYFHKLKPLGGDGKVESGLSNYETKSELKISTGAGTSDFSKKRLI